MGEDNPYALIKTAWLTVLSTFLNVETNYWLKKRMCEKNKFRFLKKMFRSLKKFRFLKKGS